MLTTISPKDDAPLITVLMSLVFVSLTTQSCCTPKLSTTLIQPPSTVCYKLNQLEYPVTPSHTLFVFCNKRRMWYNSDTGSANIFFI